jgi:RNA-directed DNA polymerase
LSKLQQERTCCGQCTESRKNKGSSGLDKLPVEDLPELLAIDRENLIDMVLSGKYLPQPILGVQIPKDNGGKRLLAFASI